MTEQAPKVTRAARIVTLLVSALWLWVIPGLSAVLVVRYLLPSASDPFEPAATGGLARFAGDHAVAAGAGFFLVFAGVARYWSSFVPGVAPQARDAGAPRTTLRRAVSLALAVGVAAGAAWFVRDSLFQSNRVLGSSMLPTLPVGAELGVNKLAYGFKLPGTARAKDAIPRRGDVIVFRSPDPSEREELVKRVIGLPGDRIGIVMGRPAINGWVPPACLAGLYPVVGADGTWVARLLLEFLDDRTYAILLPQAAQPQLPSAEYLVKPGEVFVLGDNRPVSVDSRSWNKGRGAGVAVDSISGRVARLLFSVDPGGRVDWSRILEPLTLELNLDAIDSRKLAENVQGCLKLRPKDTYAPKPGQSKGPK